MHSKQIFMIALAKNHPRQITLLLTATLIVVFGQLTNSVVLALAFGLTAGIFITAGFNDVRTGVLSNGSMLIAAAVVLAIQVTANGFYGGLIRSVVIAVIWILIATIRFARGGVGGGDLKMIGVTWLALAAFPVPLALMLMMLWALILAAIVGALRLCGVRHLRAGLVLTSAAIPTWVIGLMILA